MPEVLRILIFILLIPFLISTGCKARIKGNSTDRLNSAGGKDPIPEQLRDAYRHDAAALAIRDLNAGLTEPVSVADIPREAYENHYKRLGILYAFLQKENLPDLSGIHIDKKPDLKSVIVTIAPDAKFRERWMKGFTSTENLYLNQLIAKYDIEIKDYSEASGAPQVRLLSPENINTTEFARLLRGVSGIRGAETIDGKTGGNNIRSNKKPGGEYAISLIRGHGICKPECEFQTSWNFLIQAGTKTVTYEGMTGDPPPAK